MPVSLTSQLAALRMAAALRPDQIVRAGLAPRIPQAEVLRTQLTAAAETFAFIASDPDIQRKIEKAIP